VKKKSGPQRTKPVEAYLLQTRLVALLVVAAVIAGVVSDLSGRTVWERHALVSGLVSSVLVVMVSVAVVNEVLERRRRKRWSVLAQYVMFELVRNARMIWIGVLDLAGLLPTDEDSAKSAELGAQIVRDTARLTAAVRAILCDDNRRAQLHSDIVFLAERTDEVLGRWAAVMLNAEVYAAVIDRHVELAGDLAWLASLLDARFPPDDAHRQWRARSSAAVQIEPGHNVDWFADRLVVITQLAENLDEGTLRLALQIVPVQWWEARLGTSTPLSEAYPGDQ
jgi:hypothetical protein